MKNRIAQSTALALTAVMMSGQVIGTQAASIDYANTVGLPAMTAGFTAALAQMNPIETVAVSTANTELAKHAETNNVTEMPETGSATAGFTAALAQMNVAAAETGSATAGFTAALAQMNVAAETEDTTNAAAGTEKTSNATVETAETKDTSNAAVETTETTETVTDEAPELAETVEVELSDAVSATAGFTAALAQIQPDDVNLTLNLQGEAMLSGVQDGLNKALEEQAAAEEAARQEAEEQAAAAQAAAEAEEAAEENAAAQSAIVATQNESVAATADDVTLLAALIQCEAGNECYEGQVAVGAVVLNRLHRGYAGSIYGVIYQPYQFGPAGTGKVAAVLASGPSATALAAAQEALSGVDYTGGAVQFRNVRSGYSGTVIGNHVFF